MNYSQLTAERPPVFTSMHFYAYKCTLQEARAYRRVGDYSDVLTLIHRAALRTSFGMSYSEIPTQV